MIDALKSFWSSLLSGDETVVDSVITVGVAAFLALCAMQAYVAVQDKAQFNPMSFATGASTIIAAIGGAKGGRHWLCRDCGKGATDVQPDTANPRG